MKPTYLLPFRGRDFSPPNSFTQGCAARHRTITIAVCFLILGALSSLAQTLDYGDAPAPYPTRVSSNGARHPINPSIRLGSVTDGETDGQPNADATGDDIVPAALDDEDGVQLLTDPMVPGSVGQVRVTVTATGRLDAWIDFDGDGNWGDLNERIATNLVVVSGANTVNFTIPTAAKLGTTFARFRYSTQGGVGFTGLGSDGEVEDYQYTIENAPVNTDFGDAPRSYQTVLADNGAGHAISANLFLGASIDAEGDGQPNSTATGDDLAALTPDDEDGVVFPGAINPGAVAVVQVTASAPGRLDAWMDFNADGDWAEVGEQIFVNVGLVAGVNTLTFTVPAGALETTNAFARFRLSSQGGLPYFGPAPNGEVEDYRLTISSIPTDYSDAPDPSYPTRLASNGARHRISTDVRMGNLIDAEPDGQPNANATGDDIAAAGAGDDEDGVTFQSALIAGQGATVSVVASIPGRLDAWIDFNANGSWADAGEQIFVSTSLVAGPNTLVYSVPANAQAGGTFARFRFSRQGGLSFAGLATDGEVEDYQVGIEREEIPCDRTNKGRDFWLTFPGNYAPDPDNPIRLSLCIVGPRTTIGNVSIPGLGFSTSFVIPASMHVTISLPKAADLGDANDLIENKGIHVQADQEVAVFGMNRVRWTTDGFLGLPSDVLGTDYVVQSFANVHTNAATLNGTQFAIVACEDDTKVTIIPPVNTGARLAGVPYTITLNRADTYQLRNTNDAPADLSGTLINADKPIAVFGSHQCANIPNKTVWFCDYIVEQLMPDPRAGTNYFASPLKTRLNGDTFRFVATQNNTTVRVNGLPVAILNRGQHHQQIFSGPIHVTADKPIMMSQYSNSSDYDGVTISDPFMIVIPATKLWLNTYMVCTPDSNFSTNFINVIAPSGTAVLLDGVAIPAGLFAPIGASGFSSAGVGVLPGPHQLNTIGAAPKFGVILYGFGEYDSYGYPGGMYFTDATPPHVFCPMTATVMTSPSMQCLGVVPDFREGVEVSDNCPLPATLNIMQQPAPGTLVPVGMHNVTVSVADAAGNVGSCVIKLTVVDGGPISLTCPPDITTNAASRAGQRVFFTARPGSPCGNTNFTVTCQPPSGSVFPPGITTVACQASDPVAGSASCTFKVTVRHIWIDRGPNSGVVVNWTGGGTLEAATEVKPQRWTPLPNASSPLIVPAQGTAYFRVQY